MKKFLTLPFYLKLASISISLICLVYIAIVGKTILMPLSMSLLFALLLLPFCGFLEKKLRFPRTLASMIAVSLFFLLIGGLIFLIGTQLANIKDDWPAFQEQFTNVFNSFQEWIRDTFGVNTKKQMEIINDTAAKTVDAGTAAVGVVLFSLSSLAITCIFVFLYTFFLLLYRGHIFRFLLLLNPEKNHPIVIAILDQVKYVVKRYLIGLVIQMAIVSTLVYITLLILGVKYSLIFGLITGVINILPYVGILVAIVCITLVTFATASLTKVVIVIVAMIVIHAIDGNFIVPKIVGSKVKVNSMFAMIAIVFGEMVWGISGMFLAIPLLAIAKIIFDRITDLRAWGFLLGEEDCEEAPFEKLFKSLSQKKKIDNTPDVSSEE